MMKNKILEPGIYSDLPMQKYLRSEHLSRGDLKTIAEHSPAHALYAHQHRDSGTSRKSELGTAVGDAVLGTGEIVWLDFEDYRTSAARSARDEALSIGKAPMLVNKKPRVEAMAASLRDALKPFGELLAEHTIVYKDHDTGIMCRSRPDALTANHEAVIDIKTTTNAHPLAYERIIFSEWHDVQMRHAHDGVRSLEGIEPSEWIWAVCEDEEPYVTSIIYASTTTMDCARIRRLHALRLWQQCRQAGRFPGYGQVAYAEPPPWIMSKLETYGGAI